MAFPTKKALITGITGQDGSYLTELLLEKGYEVHGTIRRSSTFNTHRIDHLYRDPHLDDVRLFLHYGDLTDSSNLNRLIEKINPCEIYNLGAQSHVKVSFEVPEYTADTDALGVLRILDAIKDTGIHSRFYQASTSELFGNAKDFPQDEETPLHPRSPYGVAKLYGYWITRNYREAYHIHASNGILFNHESPRRGETFVTRKITMGAARIHRGLQDCLYMGNINTKRDWGYAKDYVKMMWLMLQQPEPDDYVIATGETHTVREFIEKSFACIGHKIIWQGAGVNETGMDQTSGKTVIRIDPRYFRPSDIDALLGNATKALKKLKWKPSVSFDQLVQLMTEGDLRLLDHPGYKIGF
ncbi:MAG: GDP-mannose 4,6-dehydratase [Lentisphaeria bacterium]